MIESSFERELKERGQLVYSCTGGSMLPMLRPQRDIVIIEPVRGRLKPLDVALYRRGGRYILHRVLRVRRDDYVICGDNCVRREFGIRDADVVGVLTGFVRDGVSYDMSDPRVRLYGHVARAALPLRFLWWGVKAVTRRGLRNVRGGR